MPQARAWCDRLISFRVLTLAILGLGVARLVAAFLLPQSPSPLAPDEGTYAGLAAVVATGGDWASWNSGWGAGLYPAGRALMAPAALLIFLGLDDLTAVRVVSVIYAVGSQLLLLAIARLARMRVAPEAAGGLPLVSWPMLGVVVFVLLPSNVVWSNLGLREAACAFWILGAVTSTAYLFASRDWRWRLFWGAAIAVSVTMVFQGRLYLAVALVLALAVGIVWFGKERPRISVTLAVSVLIGTVLGVTLSLPATLPSSSPPSAVLSAQAEMLRLDAESQRQAAEEASAAAAAARDQAEAAARVLKALVVADGNIEQAEVLLASDPDAAAVLEVVANDPDPAERLSQEIAAAESAATDAQDAAASFAKKAVDAAEQSASFQEQAAKATDGSALAALQQGVAVAPGVLNPDSYLERGSSQREVSALYANSAIATDSCAGVPNPLSLRWCEITRLPGAAFAVMFRPLWPLDTPTEWSTIAVLASLENFVWIALVTGFIWVLATRRFDLRRVLAIGLVYGTLVLAGMATLEGNFGTAFRHKSSVLWVICLAMVLAGLRRRHQLGDHPPGLVKDSSDSRTARRTPVSGFRKRLEGSAQPLP